MMRQTVLAASAMILAATVAQAGEYGAYRGPVGYGPGPGSVTVIDGYPGAIDPLVRGAIYNTPPTVSFVSGHYRRHRRHGVILHARS